MGYSYLGDNSLYKLTPQEVERLLRGHRLLHGESGPSEADWEGLEDFQENPEQFTDSHGMI